MDDDLSFKIVMVTLAISICLMAGVALRQTYELEACYKMENLK